MPSYGSAARLPASPTSEKSIHLSSPATPTSSKFEAESSKNSFPSSQLYFYFELFTSRFELIVRARSFASASPKRTALNPGGSRVPASRRVCRVARSTMAEMGMFFN